MRSTCSSEMPASAITIALAKSKSLKRACSHTLLFSHSCTSTRRIRQTQQCILILIPWFTLPPIIRYQVHLYLLERNKRREECQTPVYFQSFYSLVLEINVCSFTHKSLFPYKMLFSSLVASLQHLYPFN